MVDSKIPVPQRIEAARQEENRLVTIEASLRNIELSLDNANYCPYAAEVKINSDHRRGLSALSLVLVASMIAAFVAIGLSCNQQTERDAAVRTLVDVNARSVAKLETSVKSINEAREQDVTTILTAVRASRPKASRPDWCGKLSPSKRSRVKRLIGEDPCRD